MRMKGRQTIFGVCGTQCLLYSVFAVLGVCYTRRQFMIMTWRDREGWVNFVFCDDCRVGDKKERGGGWRWERCGGYKQPGLQLASLGWEDLVSMVLHSRLGLVPAVSVMVNWLVHEILLSPSFPWWFPHLLLSLSYSTSTLPSPKNMK